MKSEAGGAKNAPLDPWMTVGSLLAELKDVPPFAWVCLNGFGPAERVVRELGANEPFVVIEGGEGSKSP